MSIAITLTTINVPRVIGQFIENFDGESPKDTVFFVIGDVKTPKGAQEYCEELNLHNNIQIRYFSIEDQAEYLSDYQSFEKYLPLNSFSRRNIGDLIAYKEGFDIIIRIDDDNYPTKDDFLKLHKDVGFVQNLPVISSTSGWYNVCNHLRDKEDIPFYPRGFPYSARWDEGKKEVMDKDVKIVLNAGLWLGDPDVDAITRLCKPIDALSFQGVNDSDFFALDIGTWCPINTQNTAYSREIIPASFVPPNVGRYDDIWSGYFLRKITDHLGHFVRYGRPLLKQLRNEHNLWTDLKNEMNGNIFTDHLIQTLNNIKLQKTTYIDCYYELATRLDEDLVENRDVFDGVIQGMKIWVESISKISEEA